MTSAEPLPPSQLRRDCDPEQLAFRSTAELDTFEGTVGQQRALEALRFGIGMRRGHPGYGLFVLGSPGTGRHRTVRHVLEQRAADEARPDDWCYVADFADAQRPRALRLRPGGAVSLREDMARLVDELQAAIPAAFESEDYEARKDAIVSEIKDRHDQGFEALRGRAQARDVVLVRTPSGVALAPTRDGKVIEAADFEALPEDTKGRIEADLVELRKALQELVREAPKWAQEQREKLRDLDREITRLAVEHLIDALRAKYGDQQQVLDHLDAVQRDVIEHANQFMAAEPNPLAAMLGGDESAANAIGDFRRYQVNVLVDHSDAAGAPVVYEDQPSHDRLIGRIEHVSRLGALVTDFSLIRSGALHRANGGYLVLDARKLLAEPFAYEELERVLRSREIRIRSLGERVGLVSTVSLQPGTIPLDVKVVLIGERNLYYLLCEIDPDFTDLFKVPVDFDDSMPWSREHVAELAQLLGTMARDEARRDLERGAVARLIEHAARLAGDRQKLTTRVSQLADLVRESDYWAGEAGRERVTGADVERALQAQVRRADRLRDLVYESIRRGTTLIDTTGRSIGQVNGLSIVEVGGFAFGKPLRITARVRPGRGDVLDIEREVELGGPFHSKGVLILSGFLGQRYAGDGPLCLSASLVFEQSYAGVEGDSASAAELCALLSALAQVPIDQAIAVTGSVNQHGQIQAIGGVNEKVEGFFDVCRAGGLTGGQGVVIPRANIEHLMLRRDVVQAASEGAFRIHAVDTVDEAVAILTGVPAGQRDSRGQFPDGSVNRRVHDRLSEMAASLREFGGTGGGRGR